MTSFYQKFLNKISFKLKKKFYCEKEFILIINLNFQRENRAYNYKLNLKCVVNKISEFILITLGFIFIYKLVFIDRINTLDSEYLILEKKIMSSLYSKFVFF